MWSFGSIWRIGCSRLALFVRVRGDARHARDDEDRVGELGGKPRSPQIAAIAPSMLTGSGASVGQMLVSSSTLDGADHLDVLAFDLELQRHLEQPRGARIARVEAVAEPGQRSRRASGIVRTIVSAASRVGRAAAHQRRARRRGTACRSRCRRRDSGRSRACRPPRRPAAARRSSRCCAPPASTAASRRDRWTRPASLPSAGRSPATAARPSAAGRSPRRTSGGP